MSADPADRPPLGRRELLYLALASVPANALLACGPPPPASWAELALRAARFFAPEDLEAARAIGGRALDGFGRDEAQLAPELGPTLALLDDPLDVPVRLDAAIARDFEDANVRDVAGWILAATEAHVCALVALYDIGPESLVGDGG